MEASRSFPLSELWWQMVVNTGSPNRKSGEDAQVLRCTATVPFPGFTVYAGPSCI